MDKLIRSFTKNKSSSSNTKNKELIISENFEKNIQNWKIPVSSNIKIYRSNGFNFKSDYIIKTIEEAISLKGGISKEICADVPNAFWNRKKHQVSLPYTDEFSEEKIPTKARPIAMGPRLLNYCKEEIDSLLKKELIRPSNSPWSCPAFYVENAAEIERGAPRLVINYKPLNKALKWIKHPLPNKRDLLNRLFKGKVFSSNNNSNRKSNCFC